MRFVLGADGVPSRFTIMSSTDSAFHAPTLAALAVLRFSPAEIDGRPVATWAEIPVRWVPPAPDSGPPAGDAEAGRLYSLAELDQPPRPLNMPEVLRRLEAAFPVALRESRLEGEVVVRMRIGADGSVGELAVVRSTHLAFNGPSLEVLAHLRFSPGTLRGQAVGCWVQVPVEWTVGPASRIPFADVP